MKLNYRRTFFVGLGFFAICAFWQMYDHVIPLMLKYTFGIKDGVSGGIMALDNILALFMLPLFGMISDRTNTKWGRRMPFIVIGSFSTCAVMMLIPMSNSMMSLPLFIIGLGLSLFCMSTYRSPAVALMPDVTPKPLRSKANAVINLMGAIGGIIILAVIAILLPPLQKGQTSYRPDYMPVFFGCMIIMALATIFLIVFIDEPKETAAMHQAEKSSKTPLKETEPQGHTPTLQKKYRLSMSFLLLSVALWYMGYNGVVTSFSKYCIERFGIAAGGSALILIVAQIAAIISYLPVGIISSKIGRKKCILFGALTLSLSFAISGLFKEFSPVLYLSFIMSGVAWAAINVNSYPMVVEMASGANMGRFTGIYYTASMAAQIITPILSGLALQYLGYNILLPYGALFAGLSFITMLFVRHGDSPALTSKSP